MGTGGTVLIPLSELSEIRDVAQFGSAPALGAGGRRFKSGRPDQHAMPYHSWTCCRFFSAEFRHHKDTGFLKCLDIDPCPTVSLWPAQISRHHLADHPRIAMN